MALRKYQRISVQELPNRSDVNRIQDSIQATLNPITAKSWEDTSILKNVSLLSGQTNLVPHLLNRIPVAGYKVLYKSAEANIWDAQVPDDLFFYLRSSANCTVTLEVS